MGRIVTPAGLAVAVACLLARAAAAQGEPFPDDWFYRGADRPAALRALEGQPAPALAIAEWRGEPVALADQRGKVVVVDFWATWCGPCMGAIPENVELVAERGGDGLVFVGVHDSKRGWDKVDQVIADKGINYPVGKDDGGTSTQAFALQFWPTYVVIDKRGIVRGAGLLPNKVADAVAKLLDEDGPVGVGPKPGGFPDAWFLGGEKRSPAFRAVEGKAAPVLAAAAWHGSKPTPEAFARQVVVYQFVRPELSLSLAPLAPLVPLAKRYGEQGVTFVAVCDARSDFERMAREAAARKVEFAVAHDAPPAAGKPGAGAFAEALGVRFAPATVIVDRAGVVRAAGLHVDRVDEVLDRLLAEPMPPVPDAEPDAGGAAPGAKQP